MVTPHSHRKITADYTSAHLEPIRLSVRSFDKGFAQEQEAVSRSSSVMISSDELEYRRKLAILTSGHERRAEGRRRTEATDRLVSVKGI